MKTKKGKFCGIIAVILMAALVFTACKKDPPEDDDRDYSEDYGWSAWRDPGSSAKLDSFSVNKDNVATIKTSGVAEQQGDSVYRAWTITAEYAYTSKANARYKYTIQAWKEPGASDGLVHALYYEDVGNAIYLGKYIWPTTTPTIYTIYGNRLPGKLDKIAFQCANLIGTFYLKVVSIEEFDIGELTITNYEGPSDPKLLWDDVWSSGYADIGNGKYIKFIQHDGGFGVADFLNNPIILNVFNAVNVDGSIEETTPFTGTVTVQANKLEIAQWGYPEYFYTNKVPITFTNGNAAINFGTQMEFSYSNELIGDLTVTNLPGEWVYGEAELQDGKELGLRIDGESYVVNYRKNNASDSFDGNGTAAVGDLRVAVIVNGDYTWYKNKNVITFTNGNAAIDFATDMEEGYGSGGGGGIPPGEGDTGPIGGGG